METSPKLVKDPVCGMMVNPAEHEVVHEDLHYAFCSVQCRERFVARPGLYVGVRGLRAPKEQGMALPRQRRIPLGRPLTETQATDMIAALREMMGVTDARYIEESEAPGNTSQPAAARRGAGAIEITYDLLQATVAQLERKIAEVGGQLSDGLGEKVRREFVQYLEDSDLADIEVREAHVTPARRR